MVMKKLALALVSLALAAALLASGARPAYATLELQKKAKAAGYETANCLYCHNEKLPRKGAVTHNDRGKWLVAEKDKRKAKEIDVAWLKDYTVPK
jgi:hypothetical protein